MSYIVLYSIHSIRPIIAVYTIQCKKVSHVHVIKLYVLYIFVISGGFSKNFICLKYSLRYPGAYQYSYII